MRFRRAVFLTHLTAGTMAGIVIFFLAATGFLISWEKPIIAWAERDYRAATANGAAPAPVDQLLANAESASGRRGTSVTVYADPMAPAEVDLGREQRLFLNRTSGAVLGPGAVRTRAFFATVTGLHRWFGAPPDHRSTARFFKGAFDLALLAMIITGAYLWLPRVWSGQRVRAGLTLRPRLSGKARDWNWHNVLGFWAAIPLSIVVLTGAVLSYGWATNLLYLATGSPLPPKREAVSEQPQPKAHKHKVQSDGAATVAAVSLQQIVAGTESRAAGWKSIRVDVPHGSDPNVELAVDFSNGGRPDQVEQMRYDRASGSLLSQTSFASLSSGRRLRSFMKYIHTGEAGGLAGETAAGLTALACCGLVWTGLSLALRRLRTRNAGKISVASEATRRREYVAASETPAMRAD